MLCCDHAVLLKATTQDVRRETTCGLRARVRLLPATTRSSTNITRRIPVSDAGGQCETKHCLSWTRKRVVAAHYKKDDLLHCWTSSSDISGYHADFNEGHGTSMAGERHGHGMLCVNPPLMIWGTRTHVRRPHSHQVFSAVHMHLDEIPRVASTASRRSQTAVFGFRQFVTTHCNTVFTFVTSPDESR